MKLNKYCFAINSFQQASETIEFLNSKNIDAIIYIKHYLIDRLGIEWINMLNILLNKNNKKYKLYLDCKNNYGLAMNLIEKKIHYLKIDANSETLKRLNQVAKKNKVLLNPKFSIVDLSKIKNIVKKINKLESN